MATGSVFYWNGASGWIRQTNAEQLATSSAGDCLFTGADVVSGEIAPDASVTFTISDTEPWLAHEVTVV